MQKITKKAVLILSTAYLLKLESEHTFTIIYGLL
jgi:hypothetical protein